uniref:Putative secreted protein n=1 Tax=Anopheles darlingi TaxID=43151 RepID=A0A2M4DKX4_ANODA
MRPFSTLAPLVVPGAATLLFRSLVSPSISCCMTDSSSTSRSSTSVFIFSPISSMMAFELAFGCTSLRKANKLSRSTESLLCKLPPFAMLAPPDGPFLPSSPSAPFCSCCCCCCC